MTVWEIIMDVFRKMASVYRLVCYFWSVVYTFFLGFMIADFKLGVFRATDFWTIAVMDVALILFAHWLGTPRKTK